MDPHIKKLVSELGELDLKRIMIDGKLLKPSQCFRFETDPLHFMFNTNCPEELKQQVQAIFKKYVPAHENLTS